MIELGICLFVVIFITVMAHTITRRFWTVCSIIGILVFSYVFVIVVFNAAVGDWGMVLASICFGATAFIVAMIVGIVASALTKAEDDT